MVDRIVEALRRTLDRIKPGNLDRDINAVPALTDAFRASMVALSDPNNFGKKGTVRFDSPHTSPSGSTTMNHVDAIIASGNTEAIEAAKYLITKRAGELGLRLEGRPRAEAENGISIASSNITEGSLGEFSPNSAVVAQTKTGELTV